MGSSLTQDALYATSSHIATLSWELIPPRPPFITHRPHLAEGIDPRASRIAENPRRLRRVIGPCEIEYRDPANG